MTLEMKILNVVHLGTMEYEEAHRLQRSLVEARAHDKIEDTLLLLDHHPTIVTYGTTMEEHHWKIPKAELEKTLQKKGWQLREVERGGKITVHNRGQIVGYPITKIESKNDLPYNARLCKVMKEALEDIGVTTDDAALVNDQGTIKRAMGIWIKGGNNLYKIGATGIAVAASNGNFITWHGFVLNVGNSLTPFKYIKPCGIEGIGTTSVKELQGDDYQRNTLTTLRSAIMTKFKEVFRYDQVNVPKRKDIEERVGVAYGQA